MNETKLAEFVAAQNSCYDQVRAELIAGRKDTHWMWFVFPQVAGLGSSTMAVKFAIGSLSDAKHYLQHPILGSRLRECTTLLLAIKDKDIESILGSPDNMKFRSCMTLFAAAAPDESIFPKALVKYFNGTQDSKTLELIGKSDGEK